MLLICFHYPLITVKAIRFFIFLSTLLSIHEMPVPKELA